METMLWKAHLIEHQNIWVLVLPYCKLFVETLDTIIAFPFRGFLLNSLAREGEITQVAIGSEDWRAILHNVTNRGMNGYDERFRHIWYWKTDQNPGRPWTAGLHSEIYETFMHLNNYQFHCPRVFLGTY